MASKYNETTTQRTIVELLKRGALLNDVCATIDVSREGLRQWRQQRPELAAAIDAVITERRARRASLQNAARVARMAATAAARPTAKDRFFALAGKASGAQMCRPWLGAHASGVYPFYNISGNSTGDHRACIFAWQLVHRRRWPAGARVGHSCGHVWCVEGTHVIAVRRKKAHA
jgi:hypothetical protein